MPQAKSEETLLKQPLLFYIKSHRRAFALGILFLLITNILDGIYPLIIKQGIDQIVAKEPFEKLLLTSLLFFLVMACLAGTRYFWRVQFGRYHTLAAEDLRNRIFKHFMKLGPLYFQKNPVGELMSLITNDVQSFRQGIGSGILILADAITMSLVMIPIMIYLNASWAWKTMIFLPLVPFFIHKVTQLIFINFKKQQDSLSVLAGISQETIGGIRVLKSFAQEHTRLQVYNLASKDFEIKSNKTAQIDAFFAPVMELGVATGSVVLLFIAADDIVAGLVSVGTLIAYLKYIQKMGWPMTAFGLGLSQFQKGMASFQRIKQLLQENSDIPDNGSVEINSIENLKVKNLSFSYPGTNKMALEDISFSISKGEFVGLVGPIGSGKSTLLHLLTRLYPATEGSVLINDINIEKIKQNSLYQNLNLVTQEPFLFSHTIRENINFARQQYTSEEESKEWAKIVDLDSEIESLPLKYESHLGERGINLSGGQKQRLTIARGLITRASLIILDDSLSAVDTKTENKIQSKWFDRKNQQSLLVVTHRLSAIENADKIIVLNHGKIEAIGRHQELLKISPTYSQLALLQRTQHESIHE